MTNESETIESETILISVSEKTFEEAACNFVNQLLSSKLFAGNGTFLELLIRSELEYTHGISYDLGCDEHDLRLRVVKMINDLPNELITKYRNDSQWHQ